MTSKTGSKHSFDGHSASAVPPQVYVAQAIRATEAARMTEPRYLFSAELFQSPAPFSHVAVSRLGLAFISGLIGQAPDTGELVSAELRPQAEAMFDNFALLLTEAGLDARDVLRITLYLTSYEDFAEINAIYRERLSEPYPSRVTTQVAGLPLGARVQIDAVVDAAGTATA